MKVGRETIMTEEIIRLYYRFYGTVQGVGFRWHALNVARQLPITGRIKNLSDGSVEAEVQGQPQDIQKWFTKLYEDRFSKIRNVEVTEIQLVENETQFKVDTRW